MYVMMCTAYQTMHNAMCTNADKHSETLRASVFVQGLLTWLCHCRLVHLIEYYMYQQATVVNQPPFPPISNITNNTLDGVDINGV